MLHTTSRVVPGGRCYWCNESLDSRDRITAALALIVRHLPDVDDADLDALPHHVTDLERVAEMLAATAHAGADDA